jgi:glycosyltransferase involved in cell wall biosynthesis
LCEGCAKTTCEAAACGLPQITTRESGDVVQDGYNGVIIPRDDVDALCAALERLYRHPEQLAPMRLAARQRAVEHFSWERYRDRLLAAYRRAAAAKGL